MAKTYPLSQSGPKLYSDKSPSAVTNQAEQYKKMLDYGTASEDVGLFYQLNQSALSNLSTGSFTPSDPRSRPIEAGGVNT